jgi:hypothetical protein
MANPPMAAIAGRAEGGIRCWTRSHRPMTTRAAGQEQHAETDQEQPEDDVW